MADGIFIFMFFVFIVLFFIYSRIRKVSQTFRHNMDEPHQRVEPPEPVPRRTLEETLKALTKRYEAEKPEVIENPAENLLQEVRERRAKELAERNKSLREIPEKVIVPKLGTPIVESEETKMLREQLAKERKKNKDMHFSAYRSRQEQQGKYGSMLKDPNSLRDVFVASEIFKTKF